MEVKINREIRDYTESMFFGLSPRQFFFSLVACGVAVGLYFLLRPYVGMETVSWMCVLGAAPFAALGFIKYHGIAVIVGMDQVRVSHSETTGIPSGKYVLRGIEREYCKKGKGGTETT